MIVLLFAALLFARTQQASAYTLETILCVEKCVSDCKAYATPLGFCFNAQQLFPSDPSWSEFDILDELIGKASIKRSFHTSSNGTCVQPTDEFVLPLNQCIGPWGEPRPWGKLILLQDLETTPYWQQGQLGDLTPPLENVIDARKRSCWCCSSVENLFERLILKTSIIPCSVLESEGSHGNFRSIIE